LNGVELRHSNVIYKILAPFTKYACCTCEWALHGNLCKCQVIIFLTYIDLTKNNTIKYFGTWYGIDYGGFKTMFMNPMYLQLGDAYLEDVK